MKIIDVYVPHDSVSNYIKQKLIGAKRYTSLQSELEIFNIPSPEIDRTRQKQAKTWKT